MKTLALSAFLLSGFLCGQSTIQVNGNDLPKAIAAAKPGDILLFSGNCSSDVIINKPIYIHGSGTASIGLFGTGRVIIHSIPKGREAVLQGIDLLWAESFTVVQCPGTVVLSRCKAFLSARSCSDLVLVETTTKATELEDCRTTMFRASSFPTGFPYQDGPGLRVVRGSLQMADSSSDARFTQPPSPGIELTDAVLTLSGATVITAGSSNQSTHAIGGTNARVMYDKSVSFVGSTAFGPGVKATELTIPVTRILPSAIGGYTGVSVSGEQDANFGLFVGTPGPAVTIPGFGGEFELASPIPLRFGVLPSNSTLGFAVPNDPNLRGIIFRWQSGTLRRGVGQWSNPVSECHY